MKRYRLAAVVTGTLVMALLAGCSTTRPGLAVQDGASRTQEAEGIVLKLDFLDEDTLRAKHGPEEGNPFIFNRPTAQSTRMAVFELELTNSSNQAVKLRLNQVELRYGGKVIEPLNRFQLIEHWNWRKDIDDPRAYDHNHKVQLADRFTLESSETVPPRGTLSGYLVFHGNMPRSGEAEVSIPVLSSGERQIHDFRFNYAF